MDLKLSFVILNSASESPVNRHIYQGGFPGVFWGFFCLLNENLLETKSISLGSEPAAKRFLCRI